MTQNKQKLFTKEINSKFEQTLISFSCSCLPFPWVFECQNLLIHSETKKNFFVRESDWQKDDQMPVAHDDLYAQSWNTKFGPNQFEDGPPDHTQNNDDVEYVPVEVPENNHPPSLKFLEKGGGAQWSSPLKAKKKIKKETPQEICDDEAEVSQKTPNENTPETQTQKTPENRKYPIARRTHKYTW